MLRNTIKNYTKLLQIHHRHVKYNILPPIQTYSCLCGQVYIKKLNQRQYESLLVNSRVYSTQSDHHRQKVVIEAANVIDNRRLQGKVLQDEKNDVENRRTFWRDKIDPYMKLARWDRPIGVYLLYWPCAWSIALATVPGVSLSTALHTAALFFTGAALMRGAGCTINDMWDRDVDAQVERTKDRPLVSGAITQTQATVFLAAQLTLALGVLLQLNCFSVALGASSMILVVTYPLAKRFTRYPQVFLGATFNWGALLGYGAVLGALDAAVCAPLYAAAVAWTVLYDTIYAHQDKLDDARIGMKSTALTFGERTKPALCACLAFSAASLHCAGAAAGLDVVYDLAVAAYVAHAGRQIYTLDTENPEDCAKKFRSNSTIGLIILLGIIGGGYSRYMENIRSGKVVEDKAKSCLFS